MKTKKERPPTDFSTGGFFTQDQLKAIGVKEESRIPTDTPKKPKKKAKK